MSEEKPIGLRFGDLMAQVPKRVERQVAPAMLPPPSIVDLATTEEKLRRLADISKVPYSKLRDEIQGPSGLAEIARLILNIESDRRGRGRPAKVNENWLFFVHVTLEAVADGDVDRAIRVYVNEFGSDEIKKLKFGSLKMKYKRECRKWTYDRGIALSDLFSPPAPWGLTK